MNKKLKIFRRISACFLAIALLLTLPVQPVLAKDPADASPYSYEETDKESVHVVVTVSCDGIPIVGHDEDETTLAHLDVNIPWFSLEPYGLTDFERYHTKDGTGAYIDKELIRRPTLLHLYIYLLERYCMGLSEDECGQGQLQNGVTEADPYGSVMNMKGDIAYEPTNKVLNITGSPTSLYMQQFWGHDENLMYYRNHVYPLMSKGWGATADYILLSDDDSVDLAMFTNWNFWTNGAFLAFEHDSYTCTAGETLTGKTLKYDTSPVADGGSGSFEAAVDGSLQGYVVLGEDRMLTDQVFDAGEGGTWSVTFDKPGTYYIVGLDANAGTEDASCAPPTAKVTVKPVPMLGDINQDGTVTRRDASMVWSIAKGTRTVGDDIMKLADVNGDGQVDALDSAMIYGYVSGKIKEFSGKLTE